MWTGSEWIPSPPMSGDTVHTSLSLAIEDSVVMGDVNQVYNDEEAMISAGEYSIIDHMIIKIRKEITLGDDEMIKSSIVSLYDYCNSSDKMGIVDRLIPITERRIIFEKMIDLVRNIEEYPEIFTEENSKEQWMHYGKQISKSEEVHDAAIVLNHLSENPSYEDSLLLEFSNFEYILSVHLVMLDKLQTKRWGSWRIDDIILLVGMMNDCAEGWFNMFPPKSMSSEYDSMKMEIKQMMKRILDCLTYTSPSRRIVSTGNAFLATMWTFFVFTTPFPFVLNNQSFSNIGDFLGVLFVDLFFVAFPLGLFGISFYAWIQLKELSLLSKQFRSYIELF
jgi:hypothetical protein